VQPSSNRGNPIHGGTPLGKNALNDKVKDRGQQHSADHGSPKRIERVLHDFLLCAAIRRGPGGRNFDIVLVSLKL
jgi:hypothetical protein